MSKLKFTFWTTRARRKIVGVAGVLALFSPLQQVSAEEMLIVLTSDAAPYTAAADACENQLKSSGHQTKRVLLSTLSPEEVHEIQGSVISIGGRASINLARDLRSDVHLYYCMTPKPAKLELDDRPNTSGISTEIDFSEQAIIIDAGLGTVKRVGMLYRSSSSSSTSTVEEVRRSIPTDWELVLVDLDEEKSASKGIKKLLERKIDIVWTVPDTAVYNSSTIKALLLESIHKKIPVFGFSHALVRAGATFGVGINPAEQGSFVASLYLDRRSGVFNSAEPKVAVNQIAADRIRLKFKDTFIREADVVFEAEN
jgi:ABC-type uncharacterized transport system substrate-binding protein